MVDDKPVKVTPIEFKILLLLIQNPGRVFPAEEIYERVWNERAINTDTVSAAINAIASADLLIVVGTSFVVYPFAGLIGYAQPDATIVAVNREQIALPQGGHMVLGDATDIFADLHV